MILATDEDTKVKDAVALRFKELCEERNISPNALAVRSGVTPSTVYSMLDSSPDENYFEEQLKRKKKKQRKIRF